MPDLNPFEVFGVEVSFNVDENFLTQKFIELQKKYHPDLPNGSVEISLQVTRAYYVLSNPIQRGDCILQIFGIDQDLHSMPENFFSEVLAVTEKMLEISEEEASEIVVGYKRNLLKFGVVAKDNVHDFATAFIRYKYTFKAFVNSHGA